MWCCDTAIFCALPCHWAYRPKNGETVRLINWRLVPDGLEEILAIYGQRDSASPGRPFRTLDAVRDRCVENIPFCHKWLSGNTATPLKLLTPSRSVIGALWSEPFP
jgi:hypothetical protein